ncbi:MAG TPA: shikimate dehydrogenase [Solirubrobacteraceae bacterium]|nr:shikimate dehydrogenase [Solirubrobacteraceae bacterium]
MRTRLGVLGWPVAHSRSPAMHNRALAHLGLAGSWRYQLLPVPPALFAETVRALPGAGFRGANVTIPHKEASLALSDAATPAARAIGAVNTLTFADDGTIAADNTDAPGFLDALGGPERVAGRSALVLGAGGSARAVVWALRGAGAADVAVWNRTPERAEALARDLGARAVTRVAGAQLLVNCTSVGLQESSTGFNELPVAADGLKDFALVADMVYRPGGTALLAQARAAGCATVDGLEILARQGARSLEGWLQRPAPVDEMRQGARG